MQKNGKCRSAIILAVWGVVTGFILPSIGVTLAISGLIVNTIERKHYDMRWGLVANIASLILSVISWRIGAKITGLI